MIFTCILTTKWCTFFLILEKFQVCFSVGKPGVYKLDIKLVWTKTDVLIGFAKGKLAEVNGLARKEKSVGDDVDGFER